MPIPIYRVVWRSSCESYENYVKEGIPVFRSQNVWKDYLKMDDIAYIDAKTHASMKRSSLKHGDILMTKTGRINTENSSLGRAALYEGEDDMANVNGHVYFIRLKEGVNNKFVLRILVSSGYRDLIRSVCVGGIDKRQLNKEHIEEFPIICPPSDLIKGVDRWGILISCGARRIMQPLLRRLLKRKRYMRLHLPCAPSVAGKHWS